MPRSAHLHFGPGPLGLGLIIHATHCVGIECHAVSPPDGSLARRAPGDGSDPLFELISRGDETADPVVPIASHSFAGQLDELRPDARGVVESVEYLLVTAAVGTKHLAGLAGFLLEVAEARARVPDATTVFIPCENDRGKDYPELQDGLKALGVDCRLAMVDRVCAEPDKKRPGGRLIEADSFREWVIQGEPLPPPLDRLDKLEWVHFVADYKPYEERKRWLVNGLHLLLGVEAHAGDHVELTVAAGEEEVQSYLSRIQDYLAPILEERHPVLSGTAAYNAAHLEGWIGHADKTQRVMRRFKRATLADFLENVDRKVGDLSREVLRTRGELPPELIRFFDELHDLLTAFEKYYVYDEDDKERKRPAPRATPATDAAAAKAYRVLLTDIFDAEHVARQVQSLEEELAQDRADDKDDDLG